MTRPWLAWLTASAASRRRARQAGARPKPIAVDDREGGEEAEQPPVERQRERDRIVGAADLCDQEARSPDREGEPRDRSRHGQQQAFGQQLADQAVVRGAEREARRELMPPGGGARQQEIRDVGAGDEQHQRDDAGQRDQRLAVVLPQLGEAGRGRLQRQRSLEEALQRLGRTILGQ